MANRLLSGFALLSPAYGSKEFGEDAGLRQSLTPS
ncbi:hypothetical protein Metal_3118 [Methylomicrobium album BG8]|uniref:Uncharacterized protein n=1 Tax=Methylomicrobium album BG8 TaxID=686340 RepID=H8GNN8_METAL|nr:hypothetical protein Metal_3118 [Methylomicrobium album BG8]